MNRDKVKKVLAVAVILVIAVACVFRAGMVVGAAGDAKPGSVNDPLITKSYLDSYISNLNLNGSTEAGYKKVTLSKGSIVVGQEGTEILLYSGSANAYVKGQPIVNITMGEAYESGMTLSKYCVYICPDSNGGMVANSDVVIYIKGQYTKK